MNVSGNAAGGPRARVCVDWRPGMCDTPALKGKQARNGTPAIAIDPEGGGAVIPVHSGQSNLGMDLCSSPLWCAATFSMASIAAQCGAVNEGLTNGDAIATLRYKANHTSMKRVMW